MIWNRCGAVAIVAAVTLSVGASPSAAQWSGSFGVGSGLDGDGLAATEWNSQLAVSGYFFNAGGQAANGIALWNGTTWSALGMGLQGGPLGTTTTPALTVFGGDLIAGGDFTLAGSSAIRGIASWNGSAWSGIGGGLPGSPGSFDVVAALTTHSGNLIAGGVFEEIGGETVNNIASWTGTSWSDLDLGTNGDVSAVYSHSTGLYAGGAFTTAGGQAANRFARWTGVDWDAFGSGLNGPVRAICAHDFGSGEMLVLGGNFTMANGVPVDRCVVFNPNTDTFLTGTTPGAIHGFNEEVRSLKSLPVLGVGLTDALVAGGAFTDAGGWPVNRVSFWDNDHWQPVGTGLNGEVNDIATFDDELYAVGQFSTAGGAASMNIASYGGGVVPVALSSFDAARFGRDVVVRWTVGAANDHAGFHVHRDFGSGAKVQLTNTLLSGRGAYSFTDTNPPVGDLRYWLEAVDVDGASTWFGPAVPSGTADGGVAIGHLAPVSPNPARGAATVSFEFDVATMATVTLFDAAGREISALYTGSAAGRNSVTWDGLLADGRPAPAGIYFVTLRGAGVSETQKFVLAR